MIINDLKLPDSFVELIRNEKLMQEMNNWQLHKEVDAYGNFLEVELSEIFNNETAIIRETKLLPEHFVPDGYYGEPSEWQDESGFIPDIVDFSKIICFGLSFDGAPFCFDFRDNLNEPSVIWWSDAYWRKIATDFDSFIALFNFSNVK